MRRMSIVATVLVSLLIMTFINIPSASALSCVVPASTVRSYFDADAVFSGRPIPTVPETTSPKLPANKQVTFKIYRSYKGKGISGGTITIFTGVWGRNFIPDTDYLVYANRGKDGNLYDNACGRTKFLSAARESLGDITTINIVQLVEVGVSILLGALILRLVEFIHFQKQLKSIPTQQGNPSKTIWGNRYLNAGLAISLIMIVFLYLVPLLEKISVNLFLKPPY